MHPKKTVKYQLMLMLQTLTPKMIFNTFVHSTWFIAKFEMYGLEVWSLLQFVFPGPEQFFSSLYYIDFHCRIFFSKTLNIWNNTVLLLSRIFQKNTIVYSNFKEILILFETFIHTEKLIKTGYIDIVLFVSVSA